MIVALGILIVIGCLLFIRLSGCFFKRRARADEETGSEIAPVVNIDAGIPAGTQSQGRQFSLAELKCTETGRYSWI